MNAKRNISADSIRVLNARPQHAEQVCKLLLRTYGFTDNTPYFSNFMRPDDVKNQIKRFPEGQFVALHGRKVVGMACTMLTDHSPYAQPLSWYEAIGDRGIRAHKPEGTWLYGVEIAVDPNYQGQGIGKELYKARFKLARKLGVEAFFAGGMLIGYRDYRHQMSVDEYARRVASGELYDPTVSVQMKRGFQPRGIIRNYCEEPDADDTAMLIVWENPEFEREY